jgi:hypothetical protein
MPGLPGASWSVLSGQARRQAAQDPAHRHFHLLAGDGGRDADDLDEVVGLADIPARYLRDSGY